MTIRKAQSEDLPAIIKMIADDQLGKTREEYRDPLPQEYVKAFERINNDPNQELIVVENEAGEVIGTLQLTFIPYLTYKGSYRAQIEAVRVRKDYRSRGIGTRLFQWAIDRSREKGIPLVQLTSNKNRSEALKFYERLGFSATHEGFKLYLSS